MAGKSSICTRDMTAHSVFGQPSKFSDVKLPTCEDVFKAYLFYRNEAETAASLTQPSPPTASKRDIAKRIADDLLIVWNKATMPTIAYKSILISLEKVIHKGQELQKYSVEKRSSVKFQTELRSFAEVMDICSCKCVEKGIKERSACLCKLKVPQIEWNFWLDQKSRREMYIGDVDRKETKKIQKKRSRIEKFEAYKKKQAMTASCSRKVTESDTDHEQESRSSSEARRSSESCQSEVYEWPTDSSDDTKKVQNRHSYPELSRIMERTGVSNRDACKVINACLKDLKLDVPENILDPAKLRRQRIHWREREVHSHLGNLQQLRCIGFDGRIDETRLLTTYGTDQTRGQEKRKEDHYVIVSFPDGTYVDHVAPQSGKSDSVASEILSVLKERDSQKSLCAIVSDGTVVNTGMKNGIIRIIERELSKPLQWLVCLLHCNEIPFRDVCKTVDGEATGPITFKGPIGKELLFDVKHLDLVSFDAVQGNTLPVSCEVASELSKDQLYLLTAALAVQLGSEKASQDDLMYLKAAEPGAMHHARWLTRANRILRLYMSKVNPSNELKQLVEYVVKVYAPSWFRIKCNWECKDGARNFHFILSKVNELPIELAVVAQNALVRNCYYAHPENILLSAVSDSDHSLRQRAVEMILDARRKQHDKKSDVPRVFSISQLNLNVRSKVYFDMLDWKTTEALAPPILQDVEEDELRSYCERIPDIPKFPCHSQGVERMIKEVTRASSKVFEHGSRHGMIVSAQSSRRQYKKLESKKDFMT